MFSRARKQPPPEAAEGSGPARAAGGVAHEEILSVVDDDGWELVGGDVAGAETARKLVTSRPESQENCRSGSDQSDAEETKEVSGDEEKSDLSQLPAGSSPSFLATILVAMAASLFLLLSMYMAVGIFSLLVGTPPVRQSGALTFYEFSADLQQNIRRPIRTNLKLSTPTRRLLESCVMNESPTRGADLVRSSEKTNSFINGMVTLSMSAAPNTACRGNSKSNRDTDLRLQNTSAVVNTNVFSNALIHPFLPRLCAPPRFCLAPPETLSVCRLTATADSSISTQNSLMIPRGTSKTVLTSACEGCIVPDFSPAGHLQIGKMQKGKLEQNASISRPLSLRSLPIATYSTPNSRKSNLSPLFSSSRQHQLELSEKPILTRPMQLATCQDAIVGNAIR